MVEDDDDKVRRNLVAAGAAVVLLNFLEVSLGDLVAFTFKNPVTLHVSEWRIWAAVLAVLFYLGLRLRFSSKTQALSEALKGEFLQRLPEGAQKRAERALQRAEASGASTQHLGFDIRPLLEEHKRQIDETKPLIPVPYGPAVLQPKFLELRPHGGRMEVTATSYLLPPNAGDKSNASLEEFTLSKLDRRLNLLRAFFLSYVYSKQATSLLIPALLGAAAAGIASFRLVAACLAG